MITQERVDSIYQALSFINVKLFPDPRVQGAKYITETIQQCHEALEKANEFFVEVSKELARLKQELNLKKLDLKTRIRAKLSSPEIRVLECSAGERLAHAEMRVDQEYKAEVMAQLQTAGQPIPPVVLSMEMEVVQLENAIEGLKILLDVILEKKSSLKMADSGVRLQEKALSAEREAVSRFGGSPRPGKPNGMQSPKDHSMNIKPVANPTWTALQDPVRNPLAVPAEGELESPVDAV